MGAMLGLSRLSSIKSPFIRRKLVHFGTHSWHRQHSYVLTFHLLNRRKNGGLEAHLKVACSKFMALFAGCGTVMMLCWPLFPTNTLVNVAAASVPFLGTMQFVLVGTGIVKDPNFVKGVGVEQGKEHMMLHGPVQYGICATLLTSVAFRKPLSVIPISIMSAGDSIAALWGFHMGKKKVPWNKGKVCTIMDTVCNIVSIQE